MTNGNILTRLESVSHGDLNSLKLTYHLKMNGWKTSFLLEWPIFSDYVSFGEGMPCEVFCYPKPSSRLVHGFFPTHLKNMRGRQIGANLPKLRGKNEKYFLVSSFPDSWMKWKIFETTT